MLQRLLLIGLSSAVVSFFLMHHLNQEQIDRMYQERQQTAIEAMLFAAAEPGCEPGGCAPRTYHEAYQSGTPRTWLTGDTVLVDIERGSVDRMLGEIDWLAQARMIPALDAGRPVGLVLYAIRTGSLYSALGVHNGDVLRAINGTPVLGAGSTGPVAPVDIRSRSFIDMDLTRQGKPLRIVALLHPGAGRGRKSP